MFKNLLIFTAGAALGSFVTWKLVEGYYEQLANEEIESVKERSRNMIDKSISMVDEIEREHRTIKRSTYEQAKDKYNLGNVATIETEETEETEIVDIVHHDQDIYLIGQEEYDNQCPEYDKIEIVYYALDDVYCDEGETMIDDLTIFGDEAIEKIQEEDEIYVRNERISTDFDITRMERSYSESVLGYVPEETREVVRKVKKYDGE